MYYPDFICTHSVLHVVMIALVCNAQLASHLGMKSLNTAVFLDTINVKIFTLIVGSIVQALPFKKHFQ